MTFERLGGLALMLGLLGCEPEAIVVAYPYDAGLDDRDSQVDAGPDSAVDAAALPMPSNDASLMVDAGGCMESSQCPLGFFCSNARCNNKDMRGSCESYSLACEPDLSPVCGCDGVTYFNDCLRRRQKVGFVSLGACTFKAPGCAVFPGSCPGNSDCWILHETDKTCDFNNASLSQCWVTPDTCDDRAGGSRFQRCGAMGAEVECMNTCQAIKSQVPVTAARSCRRPPNFVPAL